VSSLYDQRAASSAIVSGAREGRAAAVIFQSLLIGFPANNRA